MRTVHKRALPQVLSQTFAQSAIVGPNVPADNQVEREMAMPNMKWRDAILKVLKESAEPMHYSDIAQAIIDNSYRVNVGATPAATVAANLSQRPLRDKVERVSIGVYALRTPPSAQSPTPALPAPASTIEADPEDEDTVAVGEDSIQMGLINAFGMFWSRSEVDWSKRNASLLGVQQSGSQKVDFGLQAGVYLLYDASRVVYVGRVTEPRMGQRMWEHTRDRLTGRWDRFSWFGVRPVQQNGELGALPESGIGVSTLIATMEALLIEGLEPPQNRRQGDGFSALEFIQATDPSIELQRKQKLLAEVSMGLGK